MLKQIIVLCAALAVVLGKPQEYQYTADARCPADLRHFLLPHEWDCTQFYYCEYGYKRDIPRICAPGTEFSFDLQVCVHPELANCDLPNVPPVEDESTTIKEPTTTEQQTTTEQETTTEKQTTQKPTTTEEPTTIEEPTTTEKVPEITEGPTTTTRRPWPTLPSFPTLPTRPTFPSLPPFPTRPTPSTTAEPTTAEPTTAEPTTAEPTTKEPTTAEPTTAEPTTKEPTTAEPTTKEPTTTPEPEREIEWLPNGCPADFDIHHLLPHETDCHLFYYCVFGEKVLSECSSGLYFNANLQVCDWPENSGCEQQPRSICQTECHVNFWPHKDCDKYWKCEGEYEVVGTCSEGLHFNKATGNCDYICNAGCVRGSIQVTKENGETRIFVPPGVSIGNIFRALQDSY